MAALEDEKKDGPPERQNLASRKQTAAGAAPSSRPGVAPQEPAEALRCPRCDSSNTKFCYYNNYSLAQPRHFCKTCRRYWTKGGALRNVPIGGGCRKNKKLKTSSASSRLSAATFDSKLESSSSIAGAASSPSSSASVPGFRFFQAGLPPAVDFQLGSLSSFHRLPMPYNTPFTDTPNPNSRFSLEAPFGFSSSYPSLPSSSSSPSIASGLLFSSSPTQEVGVSMNIQSSLASSIESLSSLNQDLHWKLQQQRLAMLLGTSEGNTQKDAVAAATFVSPTPSLSQDTQVVHRPQPVSFQNQEFMPIKSDNVYSRKQGESTATEWFFGNSYNSLIPDPAEDSGNGNGSAQAWNDSNLQHFGSNLS